jgi:hypothetical protein
LPAELGLPRFEGAQLALQGGGEGAALDRLDDRPDLALDLLQVAPFSPPRDLRQFDRTGSVATDWSFHASTP